MYLAKPAKGEGLPTPCRGYVWQNVDADEKEAVRVICAGEHMAPASDAQTLIMYLMNHTPNLIVRATLVSVDDASSHWKISKVLLPESTAAPGPSGGVRGLGYLGSPKPVFPPPSVAPIPAVGESIVVRLDAWKCRAETMVRYGNPDKPGPASAAAVAAKLKELASTELVAGREAILFLEDSGRIGDVPAYDTIVVIPPASSARGEIEKAEKAVVEAIECEKRSQPL